MALSPDRRSSTMCGPWKLFRIAIRAILYGALTWFILALFWAFLPSPTTEHDGDNGTDYATSVLRSGKTLTRVYDSKILRVARYERQGFALDYRIDVDNLTISVGEQSFPITLPTARLEEPGAMEIYANPVVARIGDADGANLPWFLFADSVLLFWWIHKEEMSLPLYAQYYLDEEGGVGRMELMLMNHVRSDFLLAVEMRGSDPSTIVVTAPDMPMSSSPSMTYPIRVAIIHVIAPFAVFVNDLLGNMVGAFIDWLTTVIFVGLVVAMYGFLALAVFFSLWRCFRGPSFEDTVARIQGRLDMLSHNERLRFLKIDGVREKVDLICQNEKFLAFVYVCRNGWHPERDRAKAAEEAADIESGLDMKGQGEGVEKGESTSSKQ